MNDQPVFSPQDNGKSNSEFKQFIETNQEYLKQKYYEHFHSSNSQNNTKISIDQIPINNLFKYILEIFSLEKYSQENQQGTKIKKSIQKNIQQYLKYLDTKQINIKKSLDFEILKDLLVYIVQKNNIFSIQYQSKIQNVDKSDQKSKDKKQKSFKVGLNLNNQVNLSNQVIDDDNNNYVKKLTLHNSFSLENEFNAPINSNNSVSVSNEQKLLKKNIKALFEFYCRQQMQLGGIITFDRLNQETSSMSLGKCLTFAKAIQIYNRLIKREDLVSKFKKISQGKKYINFQKFQKLMEEFQLMDSTFNERIGLLTEDIRKKLKYVKLPFNTKDIQPRQKIAIRNFSSRLTQHSGQTSQELKIQLQEKKKELIKLKKIKQFKEFIQLKQSRPQLIKHADLKSVKAGKSKDLSLELSFIGSIIHPQDDDQTYLRDHLIPRLQKQTQKIPKYANIFETQRYKSYDKLTLRKLSVVSDIRRRISEIQSSEKLSLASKLNRSQLLIQNPKKKYTPM